jgi:hypothetical protein
MMVTQAGRKSELPSHWIVKWLPIKRRASGLTNVGLQIVTVAVTIGGGRLGRGSW